MKKQYIIEDWKIIELEDYFYLSGYIKGRSPEIFEKEPAHTSKLLSIDFLKMEAETKNSIYLLVKYNTEQRGW